MIDLTTRANLIVLYSESHRHYHNLTHIYDCLTKYSEFCKDNNVPEDAKIIYAIWYHDAIYNPKSSKNEEDSAFLFSISSGNKMSYMDETEIKQMILCSKSHNPTTENEKIFCDIDMSILGSNDKEYKKYIKDIAEEYKHVEQLTFNKGRLFFIEKVLETDSIFKTDFFNKKYELKARENLQVEKLEILENIAFLEKQKYYKSK